MKKIFGIIVIIAIHFLLQISDNTFAAGSVSGTTASQEKLAACLQSNNNDTKYCTCIANGGIKLNTSFPFLGRCISKGGVGADGTSSLTAVSSAFTNIFMTLILTGGFAMIIWGGVQIAMGDKVGGGVKAGKQKIISVIVAFAVLGSLGIILRLINPNFFR